VQYNKRDLPASMPVEELRAVLGVPEGTPEVEATATTGAGVFPTVKEALKACLKIVGDPRSAPEGRSPSIIPGKRASMFPSAPGLAPEEHERLTGELALPGPAGTPALELDEE